MSQAREPSETTDQILKKNWPSAIKDFYSRQHKQDMTVATLKMKQPVEHTHKGCSMSWVLVAFSFGFTKYPCIVFFVYEHCDCLYLWYQYFLNFVTVSALYCESFSYCNFWVHLNCLLFLIKKIILMGLKAFAIVWLYVHLGIFLITHFVRKCLDSYKVVEIFIGSFLQNHVCKDLTQVL